MVWCPFSPAQKVVAHTVTTGAITSGYLQRVLNRNVIGKLRYAIYHCLLTFFLLKRPFLFGKGLELTVRKLVIKQCAIIFEHLKAENSFCS